YADMDASVSGQGLGTVSYGIRSRILSLETGYTTEPVALGRGEVWFEPQAQLVWSHNSMDRVNASYGTYEASGSYLTSRLGLRTSWRPDALNDNGYLFGQVDWLHDLQRPDIVASGSTTGSWSDNRLLLSVGGEWRFDNGGSLQGQI